MPSPEDPLYVLPFPETRHEVHSVDGVTAVAYEWGGDGPPLVFAHATGLHGRCYAPLAARLRHRFACFAIDVRAQGEATVPANGALHWDRNGIDYTSALDHLGLSGRGDVYGIGHSQGGALLMMAAGDRPGTFAGLFGFEPVVMPDMRTSMPSDNVMAKAARRRREVFASRREAYDTYRAKPPFSGIDDEALRAYVQFGFEDLDDGTVRLRCRAENEARLFEGAAGHTNEICRLVTCPTTVGLSEHTADVFKMCVPLQAEKLPLGQLRRFDGRSHFGPLERMDEMAELIVELFTDNDGVR